MNCPVSGVTVHPLVPVVVAFVVSFFTSIGGLSGAFLLLPFQVSVLGFTSPAVSPTNMVFNVFAIPSGVYRYSREGRMVWPLTLTVILGTLPGVIVGALARIELLPEARAFKFFVGWVLLYMGYRLVADLLGKPNAGNGKAEALNGKFEKQAAKARVSNHGRFVAGLPPDAVTKTMSWSFRKVSYDFYGETFSFNPVILFSLSVLVGVVGGIYGIGGGAIIAPFIVTFFGLPVYTIAGATLLGTFITSVAGVLIYLVIAHVYAHTGMAISPDWLLGLLFGIGGFAGIYCGARAQKFVPERIIKVGLAILIVALALGYIVQYFA